jgi:hemoglobin
VQVALADVPRETLRRGVACRALPLPLIARGATVKRGNTRVSQRRPHGTGTRKGMTVYEDVGGEATFTRLIARFYEGVANDPLLRPMYPDDLSGPRRRLALFLMQYFGGPATYNELRGHPRLRIRHVPFAIDRAARDAWMSHMSAALDELALPPEQDERLRRYLNDAADFLINRIPPIVPD